MATIGGGVAAQPARVVLDSQLRLPRQSMLTKTLDLAPLVVRLLRDAHSEMLRAVDALPAELAYVDKGLAPVLLAQPTYLWGYVSVQRIFDKVQLKRRTRQLKHGTQQAVEAAKEVGGVVYDKASEGWQKARQRLREFSHDRKRAVVA